MPRSRRPIWKPTSLARPSPTARAFTLFRPWCLAGIRSKSRRRDFNPCSATTSSCRCSRLRASISPSSWGRPRRLLKSVAPSRCWSTDDATVGTVIEQRRITDLPLNGRNFFSLVALSPNVTYGFTPAQQASGRLGGTRSTLTMSLSGARATWANYTLDGITNTDVDFNTYIVLPSVAALQEFKVQSGIYPAEFGREAGQVNVSTKPGTNVFHGTAFEFLRNNALDARNYDSSSSTRSATNPSPGSTPYRQNQYGFTLGGPVWIPKL